MADAATFDATPDQVAQIKTGIMNDSSLDSAGKIAALQQLQGSVDQQPASPPASLPAAGPSLPAYQPPAPPQDYLGNIGRAAMQGLNQGATAVGNVVQNPAPLVGQISQAFQTEAAHDQPGMMNAIVPGGALTVGVGAGALQGVAQAANGLLGIPAAVDNAGKNLKPGDAGYQQPAIQIPTGDLDNWIAQNHPVAGFVGGMAPLVALDALTAGTATPEIVAAEGALKTAQAGGEAEKIAQATQALKVAQKAAAAKTPLAIKAATLPQRIAGDALGGIPRAAITGAEYGALATPGDIQQRAGGAVQNAATAGALHAAGLGLGKIGDALNPESASPIAIPQPSSSVTTDATGNVTVNTGVAAGRELDNSFPTGNGQGESVQSGKVTAPQTISAPWDDLPENSGRSPETGQMSGEDQIRQRQQELAQQQAQQAAALAQQKQAVQQRIQASVANQTAAANTPADLAPANDAAQIIEQRKQQLAQQAQEQAIQGKSDEIYNRLNGYERLGAKSQANKLKAEIAEQAASHPDPIHRAAYQRAMDKYAPPKEATPAASPEVPSQEQKPAENPKVTLQGKVEKADEPQGPVSNSQGEGQQPEGAQHAQGAEKEQQQTASAGEAGQEAVIKPPHTDVDPEKVAAMKANAADLPKMVGVEMPDGTTQLITGSHRYAALKEAGEPIEGHVHVVKPSDVSDYPALQAEVAKTNDYNELVDRLHAETNNPELKALLEDQTGKTDRGKSGELVEPESEAPAKPVKKVKNEKSTKYIPTLAEVLDASLAGDTEGFDSLQAYDTLETLGYEIKEISKGKNTLSRKKQYSVKIAGRTYRFSNETFGGFLGKNRIYSASVTRGVNLRGGSFNIDRLLEMLPDNEIKTAYMENRKSPEGAKIDQDEADRYKAAEKAYDLIHGSATINELLSKYDDIFHADLPAGDWEDIANEYDKKVEALENAISDDGQRPGSQGEGDGAGPKDQRATESQVPGTVSGRETGKQPVDQEALNDLFPQGGPHERAPLEAEVKKTDGGKESRSRNEHTYAEQPYAIMRGMAAAEARKDPAFQAAYSKLSADDQKRLDTLLEASAQKVKTAQSLYNTKTKDASTEGGHLIKEAPHANELYSPHTFGVSKDGIYIGGYNQNGDFSTRAMLDKQGSSNFKGEVRLTKEPGYQGSYRTEDNMPEGGKFHPNDRVVEALINRFTALHQFGYRATNSDFHAAASELETMITEMRPEYQTLENVQAIYKRMPKEMQEYLTDPDETNGEGC